MVMMKIHLIWIVILLVVFAGCGAKSSTQLEREKQMQNSKQYQDGKFKNPIDVPLMVPGSTWKYIKKSYFTKRIDPKPTGEIPLKLIQKNLEVDYEKHSSHNHHHRGLDFRYGRTDFTGCRLWGTFAKTSVCD